MTEYEIVYSTLRDALARTYWQVGDAEVVAQDVGIDLIYMHWSGRSRTIWNDILIQAINENKIRDLLERACSGKPDMKVLKDRFLTLFAGSDPAFMQEENELLPFPLRRSYFDIVKDIMRNGTVVPVLGPSVNPWIYTDLAAHLVRLLVKDDFPDDMHVADEREKKKFVKTYYGSPCTICHFLPALVPSECPLLVFDLRLMSSLNDVSGIPTEGKNLIIVAAVNNVLHFRIFDDDGKVVVDTDELRLTGQARQIKDLRERLESLRPPHELTTSDKGRVITAVTLLISQTNMNSSVYDEQMLSVAKTNCRNLSQLYETRSNASHLYSDITDCIIGSSKDDNPIHLVLASLLKGRKADLPFQFIITTNFDAGLERVFDRQGIAYDLVWLVAAGSNRGRWLHLGYNAQEREILEEKSGTEASRKGTAFPFGKGVVSNPDPDPRVIIVKLFGSIKDPSCGRVSSKMFDEDDHFLITQDQMESFFSDRVSDLANALVSKIRSMKLLFLGFSPNDPDLRAIVDRLYLVDKRRERLPKQYWIIHRCEPGKLDQEIWGSRGDVKLLRVADSLEQTMINIERRVRYASRTV
jgi:SIR2-like domain/Effector-associated domain 1